MTAILSNQPTRTLLIGVALIVVVLNIVAKQVVEAYLEVGEEWWLIEDVLGLDHVRNSGIAFGIGSGSGTVVGILVLVTIGALIWLIVTGRAGQSRAGVVIAGLILGGALANGLDRLPEGYVTDYVAISGWPRFNVADAALTIGFAALLLFELRSDTRDAE